MSFKQILMIGALTAVFGSAVCVQAQTPAARIAAAQIQQTSNAGGDVAGLVAQILASTPAADMDAMAGTVVTAIVAADPAGAPQIIADVVQASSTTIAAKVVATVSVLAPSLGIDTTAVANAINATVTDPGKAAAVAAAAANPASVVSVAAVQTASAQTSGTPATTGSGAAVISNEIAGYGDQTTT